MPLNLRLLGNDNKSDEIKINAPDEPGLARIIAFSDWGILRGMESFSQLITTETGPNGKNIVRHQINY